jgi:hypothetical protein
MPEIVVDLEADNFLPMVDKIWVVCAKVVGADDTLAFTESASFLAWLDEVKPNRVIWHNGLCFDADVLRKVWGVPYTVGRSSTFAHHTVQFIDTMLLSQRLNPDRIGGHSLDNLAKLAGSHKIDYKGGFSAFAPEMVDYCKQDVIACEAVYKMLLKEIEKL